MKEDSKKILFYVSIILLVILAFYVRDNPLISVYLILIAIYIEVYVGKKVGKLNSKQWIIVIILIIIFGFIVPILLDYLNYLMVA